MSDDDKEFTIEWLVNEFKSSVEAAVKYGYLKARVTEHPVYGHPLLDATYIKVSDFNLWRGTGLVGKSTHIVEIEKLIDFQNPNHSRYSPKLAAAVAAWKAVELAHDPSPKQAITKWLRENADEYWLKNNTGEVNETAIEEIAKVANWQYTGGAPVKQK